MSGVWVLLAVIAVAAVLVFGLRARRSTYREIDDAVAPPDLSGRNYEEEREANRISHMSESDRAWEAASLQRNLENQQRNATPTGTTYPSGDS